MYECLSLFSEPVAAWFADAFGTPTEAQNQAWPVIGSGQNTLVVAPTGSGKTLCAFLSAIDQLMAAKAVRSSERNPDGGKAGRAGTSVHGVTVLYISPLKALGVDVAKNLETPLDGIRQRYAKLHGEVPEIAVATRSGDTTPQERRRIVNHPPDILVTTPESLFLLLTSKARRILSTVTTVIVDEVHALAGTKRGAHLAVSLERLDRLTERPAQRIGLSATVNPVGEAARFLGGERSVHVVDPGVRPNMELKVVEPLTNMLDTSATGGSVWPAIERSVLDEVLEHTTTLVFVNSRGLAEKLTARLNDLYAELRASRHREPDSPEGREGFARHYDSVVGSTTMLVGAHEGGDVITMAHHGSVSKDRRKQIEEDLKQGRLRCVVATSSLELGIDMGSVDLVIQIAPPLSVSSGLQRVGRADHKVGGVSHALFYPVTRRQIIGVAASVESMTAGDLEPLHIPGNPLDVLAQQTVAAAAMDDLDPDEWYAQVRKAAPFRDLDRDMFDSVMGMMTGVYNSEEFSAFRPPLQYNEEAGLISARPGAQHLAVTSGGTIPDRGMYTVVLPEGESGTGPRKVGELDEEMVYESRVGDVITLGTSSWQIQEITRDRVVVVPAPGRTARLPFWHGEGDGRDYGFGLAQGRFLTSLAQGLRNHTGGTAGCHERGDGPDFAVDIVERLRHDGLDDNAIGNMAAIIADQVHATGTVPGDKHVVVERCKDESEDWRIIIHAPYGKRVHAPWAMAIAARIRQRHGFDCQAYATDDGIVMRMPDGYGELPMRQLLLFDVDELQHIIETQIGETVLYMARFRECAARSLFLPRTSPGRRVPLWQQRLRAAQLLNAARTQRNFPLLLETARECLQDVYDLPALRKVMDGLNAGAIAISETITQVPSPFAEDLLFGFIGSVMYQYDVPQAERSSRLLSMDPEVLERLLGDANMPSLLDGEVIAQVEGELAGRTFWNDLPEDDVPGRVARYAKTHGPFTADRMIADLGLDAEQGVRMLNDMYAKGEVLRGHFTQAEHGGEDESDTGRAGQAYQWLHREVFRRIRTLSLAKARKAVKPVGQREYQSFLLARQGVGSVGGEHHYGAEGLMRVIEQLEGVYLNASVWESAVFPARVNGYQPQLLDELLASGDVVWVGGKFGAGDALETGRIAFYPQDSPLLAGLTDGSLTVHADARKNTPEATESFDSTNEADVSENEPRTVIQAIRMVLGGGGAFHARQLAAAVKALWQRHAPEEVDSITGELLPPVWDEHRFEQALWLLVWQGEVTNSSFAPVRALIQGARLSSAASPRRRARTLAHTRAHGSTPACMTGLWSLIGTSRNAYGDEDAAHGPDGPERHAIALVESLLDRYGVVAAPLLEIQPVAGGFSAIYPVLKRMEEHGTVARGMFVEGFGAAQFADTGTVDALRSHAWDDGSCVALDATDPANLSGVAIAWPQSNQPEDHGKTEGMAAPRSGPGHAVKPARRAGCVTVLAHGSPVLFAMPRSHRIQTFTEDEALLRHACSELGNMLRRQPSGSITFHEMNGMPLTRRNDFVRLLHIGGFTPCPQGMRLYG